MPALWCRIACTEREGCGAATGAHSAAGKGERYRVRSKHTCASDKCSCAVFGNHQCARCNRVFPVVKERLCFMCPKCGYNTLRSTSVYEAGMGRTTKECLYVASCICVAHFTQNLLVQTRRIRPRSTACIPHTGRARAAACCGD